MTETDALSVKCPRCSAGVGVKCWAYYEYTSSRYPKDYPHFERIAAAQRKDKNV